MINDEKYEAIVHFIIKNFNKGKTITNISLGKILFYSDCDTYIKVNETMTNDEYIKKEYGLEPERISEVLSNLEKKKKILIKDFLFIISIDNDIDLSNLTSKEINILNHNIRNITNSSIYDEIWGLAELGEKVPIYAIHSFPLKEIYVNDIKALDLAMS